MNPVTVTAVAQVILPDGIRSGPREARARDILWRGGRVVAAVIPHKMKKHGMRGIRYLSALAPPKESRMIPAANTTVPSVPNAGRRATERAAATGRRVKKVG
jgi:hypothetical protein